MQLAGYRPETLEYRLYGPINGPIGLTDVREFAVVEFAGDGEPLLLLHGQKVTETALLHFYQVTFLGKYDALDDRAAASCWRRATRRK